ncbi:MAG: hypothetical protein CL489_06920 [Acidobacteria bacterium]|nr:hypothetical protein [Acidobacteriota bacterium]|tara:strand:+ start:422 stop:604 length:183 start_codon:yes stop_codon:yes gene_type:complete
MSDKGVKTYNVENYVLTINGAVLRPYRPGDGEWAPWPKKQLKDVKKSRAQARKQEEKTNE